MSAELLQLLQASGVDVNTLAMVVLWLRLKGRVDKLEWQRQVCCGD